MDQVLDAPATAATSKECISAIRRDGYVRVPQAFDQDTVKEALARIRAQVPIDEKRELAEHVIDNSGTRESTEAQVRALVAELTRESA